MEFYRQHGHTHEIAQMSKKLEMVHKLASHACKGSDL